MKDTTEKKAISCPGCGRRSDLRYRVKSSTFVCCHCGTILDEYGLEIPPEKRAPEK